MSDALYLFMNSMHMSYQLIEASDTDDFTHQAVTILKHHIVNSIADHGSCILGLSGGSTPKPVYEAIGKEKIDWSRVHIFLIDERYCDPESPDSNQKMVHDTLLKNAHISDQNIVFPNTTLPLEECINKYESDLRHLASQHSTFKILHSDINILGMGNDGHIASLFPPLSEHLMGDSALVHHTVTDSFAVHDRISISLNAIAAADSQVFLLKGTDKKRVWEEMMASSEDAKRWPAKRVIENGGVTVLWSA